MIYIIIFFTSLLLTILFTPYLIEYLTKRGVVDKPGARRINTKVIPRMGGVVIYSIIMIVLFSFYPNLNELRLILISSAFVIVCGISDDIVGVKWHLKFVLQFAASIFIILYFSPLFTSIEIFGVIFPPVISYFILAFFIVGILNSINLMDGLDGLVSGFSFQIFVIILSLAVLHHDRLLMVLCAGLLGSLLGFLKYNAFPARIFLGDTGSLILGFFLTITSIRTTLNYHSEILDLTFPVILLGIPIIDTFKVMFYRIIKRRNPFLPDKNHLHHIIFGNEIHHKHTVFIIHVITLWFVCLSLFYILYKSVIVTPLFILSAFCLFSVKQIISFLRKYDVVIKYYNKIRNVPDFIIYAYEKYFLLISSIAVVAIIFYNFPTATTLKNSELFTLIVICASLLLLAVSHNRRSKVTNHIYVFFNVVVFFYLNLIRTPFEGIFEIESLYNTNIFLLINITIIITLVLMFLLIRIKIGESKVPFLSGIELIMIILVILSFILKSFINDFSTDVLSSSLFISFVIYLWYKIIILFKNRLTKYLFYSSFALPIISIIILLIR